MYSKEDVAALAKELGKREFDPPIVVGEPYRFGLALEVYDPVSGLVVTACRPHRSDIGEPEIALTADQVAAAVATARANRERRDRALGIVSPEDAKAAEDAQKKALAEKNARLEREGHVVEPPAAKRGHPAKASA